MRVCAPGRGTSAAYRASSSAYYTAAAAARRQIAMAQAAALAREKDLLRQATTIALQFNAAERAYKEGDVRVASRIYVSLTLKHRRTPVAAKARQRLTQLAEEARKKLEQIDAKLAEKRRLLSPGESSGPGGPPTPQQLAARWERLVVGAFQEYDQLGEGYGRVPEVERELRTQIAKQRRRPEFAAVLNEPEAKTLWEEGQGREQEDEQCCAYWVYKEAAKLAPARSAGLARRRFAEMEEDPEIVASAAACRELQECHKIFSRAEKLSKLRQARARELFAQVVDRAPEDSELHRAALIHIQEMK